VAVTATNESKVLHGVRKHSGIGTVFKFPHEHEQRGCEFITGRANRLGCESEVSPQKLFI
jgi:hypothetical protein